MSFHLVVAKGRNQGMVIPLKRFPFIIGRHQSCQLRAASMEISRQHCVIEADGEALRIKDLGSTNGTFVNKSKVHGDHYLNEYDMVTVGPLSLLIRLEGAEQASDETQPAVDHPTPAPPGASDADEDGAATLLLQIEDLTPPPPQPKTPEPAAESESVNSAQKILQQYKQAKR